MHRTKLFTAAVVATLMVGCSNTTRDRNVDYSGFLGDYSILEEGDSDQAERRYLRPHVDWASYDKILLDPVTLWRGEESKGVGTSPEDAQKLVDYFYAVIKKDLEEQGLVIVATPGPGTLRMQVAITKLKESHVVMDVISSVVPATLAISGLEKIITGKPSFVGQAAIEVKVTDSQSGELLGAGVVERVGGKLLVPSHFSSWGTVEDMMRLWASQGSYNLCMLQKRTTCQKPKS